MRTRARWGIEPELFSLMKRRSSSPAKRSTCSAALQRRAPGALASGEVERREAEELRRFVLENRCDSPFEVKTALLPGEARFEILHELSARPVDLVVLGTHGRGGLDRLVLGSVASTVARKAPCSVLLISSDAALAEGIADAVLARTTPAWSLTPAFSPG